MRTVVIIARRNTFCFSLRRLFFSFYVNSCIGKIQRKWDNDSLASPFIKFSCARRADDFLVNFFPHSATLISFERDFHRREGSWAYESLWQLIRTHSYHWRFSSSNLFSWNRLTVQCRTPGKNSIKERIVAGSVGSTKSSLHPCTSYALTTCASWSPTIKIDDPDCLIVIPSSQCFISTQQFQISMLCIFIWFRFSFCSFVPGVIIIWVKRWKCFYIENLTVYVGIQKAIRCYVDIFPFSFFLVLRTAALMCQATYENAP